VELRYTQAIEQLQKSLALDPEKWKTFEIPDLGKISEVDTSKLRAEIIKLLDSPKISSNNLNTWSECQKMIKRMFTAMSPFVKNVLIIAKHGQSVGFLSL
jgi:hypothetical protein